MIDSENICRSAVARLLIFFSFATVVFWAQGWQPHLIQDHIFYFQNADALLDHFSHAHPRHPLHEYWRGYSDNLSLSVILAYLYAYTESHVVSCKLVLWGTTILYLCSFYLFTSLFIPKATYRMALCLLSCFFISYGPTFWGFTDSQATLSRSLVMPLHVLLLYSYFLYYRSWLRILVFPAAAYSSLLHLSGFHLLGVLLSLELLRLFVDSPATKGGIRQMLFIAATAVATFAAVFHLANIPLRSSVSSIVPGLCLHPLPPYRGPDTSYKQVPKSLPVYRANLAGRGFKAYFASTSTLPPIAPPKPQQLETKDAWALEYATNRWRNFPPPASTILISIASAGVILLLALAGFILECRAGAFAEGKPYFLFAIATLSFAWGPQFLIYMMRHFVDLYPHNIEESRSIMYVTIPLLYYFYQLLARISSIPGCRAPRTCASLAILAFVIQPVVVLRTLPHSWREQLFVRLQDKGVLERSESSRTEYARQVLDIEEPSRRFYYSCEDVVDWLTPRTRHSTLIISNRSEFVLTGARVIGSPYANITLGLKSTEKLAERRREMEIDGYLREARYESLRDLGRRLSATYFVVPGRHAGALFCGRYYSVFGVATNRRSRAF